MQDAGERVFQRPSSGIETPPTTSSNFQTNSVNRTTNQFVLQGSQPEEQTTIDVRRPRKYNHDFELTPANSTRTFGLVRGCVSEIGL